MTLPTGVLDSRRLTGPGLLLDGPGAVLDVRIEEGDADRAIVAWRAAVEHLLREVGWTGQRLVSRRFSGGASLALTAPVDGLYAATELNELAWEVAAAGMSGQPSPDYTAQVVTLRAAVAAEKDPGLSSLRTAARSRGLNFLIGEHLVSCGSGRGALVWPAESLPRPADVDWSRAWDVPIALITGSNGKTTVVRLLAEMTRAAGHTPGLASTDGVMAGSSLIDEGDYSGPSGARLVLRRPEVDVAILETARGGILRRGLAVEHASVALITNVADDHLGEFGIETLAQLADTKLVVAKALGAQATLVLNADDPLLVERHGPDKATIIWFSLDPGSSVVSGHLRSGGTAVLAERDHIVLARGRERIPVARLAQVPITFGGSARHNIGNALAAVAGATALGIDVASIAKALGQFGHEPGDNAGRANLMELGGLRLLIDFAHNPHGMQALVELAMTLPATRRLVMVGQAGDRSDESIRQLARVAWELQPDQIVVKDMLEYLRGRSPGEVPELLADEFSRLGARPEAITRVGPDVEGVRAALEWARPGDLLVLAVHQERAAIMGLLEQLQTAHWKPGEPLPGETKAMA